MMRKLLQLRDQGNLNPEQEYWFRPSKTVEELYDLESDPDEVHNLAEDPQYAAKLEELRRVHFEWVERTRDLGMIPEPQLFAIQKKYGTTVYEYALEYPVIIDKVHELAQIASLGERANATALKEAMQDTLPTLRYWGAHGMGVIEDLPKSYQSDLYKLLDDPAPVVRLAAAWSLGKQGNQETAVAILGRLLEHETPSVASMAANRLRDFLEYAGPAKEMLEDLSEDNDIVTRGAARMTLELMEKGN
jgi:HEAT repeat protein